MKKAIFLLAIIAGSASAADVYTQGYQRSNGTYVQPHYQTAPDNTNLNNYSTQGNVNPYTGKAGTVNPYAQPAPAPTYQSYQPYQSHQRR
jgi:hypothetical protein